MVVERVVELIDLVWMRKKNVDLNIDTDTKESPDLNIGADLKKYADKTKELITTQKASEPIQSQIAPTVIIPNNLNPGLTNDPNTTTQLKPKLAHNHPMDQVDVKPKPTIEPTIERVGWE